VSTVYTQRQLIQPVDNNLGSTQSKSIRIPIDVSVVLNKL
jgi:hypothetical protein